MKKIIIVCLMLVSNSLLAQDYYYTGYSSILDYIRKETILEHSISKIEVAIDEYEVLSVFFDNLGRVTKIENFNNSVNKTISRIEFNWNSESSYLYNSLSKFQSGDFQYMTKVVYGFPTKADKEMVATSVTQYWLLHNYFLYAEEYLLHNKYINTVTRSLKGTVDYNYHQDLKLKSIINTKVTSREFSNERSIIDPVFYPGEGKEAKYIYNNAGKLSGIEHSFGYQLNLVERFKYDKDMLKEILSETNYEKTRTELIYSDNFVTKINIFSGADLNPFKYSVSYFDKDKKLKLTTNENKNNEKVESNEELDEVYSTIVNLNLRSSPSIDAYVITMIKKGVLLEIDKNQESDNWETYEINGKDITSNWVKIDYHSITGWVFKGGLVKISQFNSERDKVNNDEEILYDKNFSFEAVYGLDNCEGEWKSSDRTMIRLELKVDKYGKVIGDFGYLPCLEYGAPFGNISGTVTGNTFSVIWTYSGESTYEIPLIFTKIGNLLHIRSNGDFIKIDGIKRRDDNYDLWMKEI